jgi:energy-coupling factor transporter ATP-binding protein EcfA2
MGETLNHCPEPPPMTSPLSLLEKFRQTYRALDGFPLLEAKDIEAYRVDYGEDTLAKLEQAVDDGDEDGKVIFTGHRGCGKSTLLKKFSKNMERQGYFLVFFSIADMVELSAVDHVNILYAVALQLVSQISQVGLEIPSTTVEEILTWLTTVKTKTGTRNLAQIGKLGLDIPGVVLKLKTESTSREEVKQTFENKLSELIAKIEQIAGLIKAQTQKTVLVVIDDLDKLDLALVEKIFRGHLATLIQPKIRIVYSIPVAVLREVELGSILQAASASRIQQMEVTKFFQKADRHRPDVEPVPEKVEAFRDLLMRRFTEHALIEPETARKIVLKSGGVLRELMRIARACCSQCLLILRQQPEREDVVINDQILELALQDLRNDLSVALGASRYQILHCVYENAKPADLTDEFLLLLHSLYILEYRNSEVWYDVHPLVVDLLRLEGLIQETPAGG